MSTSPHPVTPRQEQSITALLGQGSLQAAAAASGIHEKTLRRWLHDDAIFQMAYREVRRAVVQHAIVQVQRATGEAVETLRSVMQAPEAPARVRVSAPKAMLETAVKGIDMEDLAARMRPSTRKDRSDAPAAVVWPCDPSGRPAAPVGRGRHPAVRVVFQDTPLEATGARQWAAGLRVTCPHFFGQPAPARSAAPAASTVRARRPPQVPMPPDECRSLEGLLPTEGLTKYREMRDRHTGTTS